MRITRGTLGLMTALPSNHEGKLDRVFHDVLYSGTQALRSEGGFVKGVMANWPRDDAE